MAVCKIWMKLCVATLLGASLSACSTLDLRGAWAARKIEPIDIDPKSARIAVIWPEDFGSEHVNLGWEVKKVETVIKKETFKILALPKTLFEADVTEIKRPKGDNLAALQVYALPAADIPRAEAFQEYIINTLGKKKSDNQSVTFSFFLPLTKSENNTIPRYCDPNEDAPLYIWYKYRADQPYRRIVRTKSIDKFMGKDIYKILCTQDES